MNAKKAKAVRKFLRAKGVQVTEDRYAPTPNTARYRLLPPHLVQKDDEGKVLIDRLTTVSWKLTPGSGRAVYKGMKQAVL